MMQTKRNPFLQAMFIGAMFVLPMMTISVLTVPAAAQEVTTGKRCGNCHREVPLSSSVGGTCPYCHARWGYETQHRDEHRSVSSVPSYNGQPTYTPVTPTWNYTPIVIPDYKPAKFYRSSKARHKRKHRTRHHR